MADRRRGSHATAPRSAVNGVQGGPAGSTGARGAGDKAAAPSDAPAIPLVAPTGPLPLLHRAAIAYLALPLAVWFVGWFRAWIGLPAAVLLVVALWRALSGSWRPRPPSRAAVVLLVAAFVLVALAPVSGVFVDDAFFNWPVHRAVMLDLARSSWPVYLAQYAGEEPLLLRYYLGWYLPPSLVAHAVGDAALDWAVPLWTWIGVALTLLMASRSLPSLRAAAIAVAVVLFFNGLDPVEDRILPFLEGVVRAPASAHSPHYDSLFWMFHAAPQHFLPAGLGALTALQLRNHPRFLSASGIVLLACAFWSTLVAVGLLPVFAAAMAGRGRLRAASSWQNLAAAVLAGLVALYLASGEVAFPWAWIWTLWEGPWLWGRLFLLYAAEFLIVGILVWRIMPSAVRDPCFLAAVAALLSAPLVYWQGLGNFSEWTVKFPLAGQLVVSYYAAWALVVGRAGSTKLRGPLRRPVARALLGAALFVGAVPMWRTMARVQFGPISYASTEESHATEFAPYVQAQRTAAHPPPLLSALLKDAGPADLGVRLVQSRYDVYLQGRNRLVYVRRNCNVEAEIGGWLFLEIRRAGNADTPPGSRRPPWDTWIARPGPEGQERLFLPLRRLPSRSVGMPLLKDGSCILAARLRGGGPLEIRTGQIAHGGRLMWAAEAQVRR